MGDVAEHYPGLVESIVDHGHEIACHGLHHMCKIDPATKEAALSPEEFKSMTAKSRDILQHIYKNDVIGYRAPNAYIAGWMIDALEEIGFKYDSSVNVNSFFKKAGSSVDGVSTFPYYPKKNSLESGARRDFVEFPWSYLDMGLKIPTSGGPMLRFLGSHVILKGLRQSVNRGHTVFYFHPIDISGEKFPNVGDKRPAYWVIKGKVVEKRLVHILKALKPIKKISLSDAFSSFNADQEK